MIILKSYSIKQGLATNAITDILGNVHALSHNLGSDGCYGIVKFDLLPSSSYSYILVDEGPL